MHPPAWSNPLRVEPTWVGAISARLAALGVRAFRVAPGPSFDAGDVWLTLPGDPGGVEVIVPRGFGWPRLARRGGGGWRSEPAGEPCAAVRWESAGRVAAWVRRVEAAPGGPAPEPAGEPGWLVVRPRGVAWSVARAAGRRGAVAVGGRIVQAVSPAAGARGVRVGMTAAAARRRGVEVVAPDRVEMAAAWGRIRARLEGLGEVERRRGTFWVRWNQDAAAPAREMDRVAAVVAGLAAEGLAVAAAAGADLEAARRLVAALEPGWAALVPADAAAASRGVGTGGGLRRRRGLTRWRGSLPDVESVVACAAGMAAECGSGELEVRLVHPSGVERVPVRVPERAGRHLAEGLVAAALRRPLPVGVREVVVRRAPARRPAPRWNLAPLFALR